MFELRFLLSAHRICCISWPVWRFDFKRPVLARPVHMGRAFANP
jgi:hypothetical protein